MTRRKASRTQDRAKQRTRRRGGSRRVGPVILAVLGALVVAAVIAIAATGGNEDRDSVAPAGVSATGEPLPDFTEGNDPAVGLPAPELSGEDFQGGTVTIGDDGRPKAIIFLAHWCPHCQREVPVIQDWLDTEGAPTDVDLYSVATANDPAQPNYPPDAWLEREGWTALVLVDDDAESAGNAFGLTGFPYFVFVDAEGNVVARATGELTIEQLRGYLASISG